MRLAGVFGPWILAMWFGWSVWDTVCLMAGMFEVGRVGVEFTGDERLKKIDRREMLRMALCPSAGLLSGAAAEGSDWIQGQSHSHGEMAAHSQTNAAAVAAAAKDAGAKPISLAPYVDALPRLPVIHPY